jgi:hypothetical protein
MTTTTREQRTDPNGNTLVSVWITPASSLALAAIRKADEVSATDAVNRALQAYAMLRDGQR